MRGSMPSPILSICLCASDQATLASSMAAWVSSASANISADGATRFSLKLRTSFSIFLRSSSTLSTDATTVFFCSCRSRLSIATSFSNCLRLVCIARSIFTCRAIPMVILMYSNFSNRTPRSPALTLFLKMVSRVSEARLKLYSPLAKAMTSLRDSIPSPSLSYFLKAVSKALNLARAFALVAARSLKDLAAAMYSSDWRVHLFTRSKSFWVASPISVPVSPVGEAMSCISPPFVRMNSVQAVTFAFTSEAPFSMNEFKSATSSTLSSSFFSRLLATEFRLSATFSAAATSPSNSLTRALERSIAFRRLRSSSRCFSLFRLCCSLICSILFLAWSKPFSASSRSFCALLWVGSSWSSSVCSSV
mmetsp:Transcript_49563/g.118023  ORF Transcript_49563/g.118023 Transcript_49563/m.118023 type:complete len:363 (+) Transcript_49563:276-1364(+)